MTEIRIFDSWVAETPAETRAAPRGETLDRWMRGACRAYRPDETHAVAVLVGGRFIPQSEWATTILGDAPVVIRPIPRGIETSTAMINTAVMAAVSVGASLFLRPRNRAKNAAGAGLGLAEANVEANAPRLGGVIPEIFGVRKTYPDLLNAPRRHFVDERTQAVDVMLCLGVGHYAVNPQRVCIGETPLAELGDELVAYEIFDPGEDVSGHPAHRNWYHAPEVGASTGSTGLRLDSPIDPARQFRAERYAVGGKTVAADDAAAHIPRSWRVDDLVVIVMRTRTLTVEAGGDAAGGRSVVSGELGDLRLAVGDAVMLYGDENAGTYRVHTVATAPAEAGSPSVLTGMRNAPLGLTENPQTFAVNGKGVYLGSDYDLPSGLIADIARQLPAYVVDLTPGYTSAVRITERPPYSGRRIELTGMTSVVFGDAPEEQIGVATSSGRAELTLDRWTRTTSVTPEGAEVETYVWSPATSMTTGEFSDMDAQKATATEETSTGPGGETVTTVRYQPLPYRVTAYVYGPLTTGAVSQTGFAFARQTAGGADDATWEGFSARGLFERVSIELVGAEDESAWVGPFRATPGTERARAFEVDFFAPYGLAALSSGGSVSRREARVRLQWRADGGEWAEIPYTLTGESVDQLGWTFQIDLPEALARVDFRACRVGGEQGDMTSADRVEWYGLRCLLAAPTRYDGVTTMALTLRGSDRIATTAENKINLVVARRLVTEHFARGGLSAGYVSTSGEWAPDAGWVTTPLLAVKTHAETVLSATGAASTPAVTVYDAQGGFLGVEYRPSSGSAYTAPIDFSGHPGAVFYRAAARAASAKTLTETIQSRAVSDWARYICASVGYADTDIDQPALNALETVWDARGDYVDVVVDAETTVKDALAEAFAVGFAELTIDDGKIRPARDQPRTTFEHLYTPQNMTSALKREFTAYDPDDYDGVDVEFTSATTWKTETVECRLPGDEGVRVDTVKLDGVTDRTRAWRIGMRHRRALKYRRKTFSFETELDALNSRYLSYCALADDVPGYGQSALVTAVERASDGVTVTASEPLAWGDGGERIVALRRPNGTLAGPYPAAYVGAYALSIPELDFDPIVDARAVEQTHLLFGASTRWSYPALVTEIAPSETTVSVTAMNYDARVYDDDDHFPPD